ncbi:hypothetical protein [Microvirga sp. VF16]|uniref:hypothetical protein n=1 Tax=Microvirga sp. VF16 TaxID=2807101 RepID=UPI00193EA02E|nr:hypothetical protein [Microvirga sp. VF16]QRM35634.1 hypothetical protein JO965_43185 [Microvirga sp. VF16]
MKDERYDEQEQREKLKVTQFNLFGNERRTRITLLLLALLNVGILALVAGYLFNLSWDPYSPARHLW